ncbi:MAG: glycosyltransferase, partial [Nitrospirae bacterium]|nr:glycosyltransferase [Nitrospirota bacterium]
MPNNKPLVSIIVRTKDRPNLLKKALKSIALQTYRPVEVIIVNDGGCDLDLNVIKGILGNVYLNYVRLAKSGGRAHAGNVGIENAKGNYIGFLDDDDEYYPEHINTLQTFLEQSDYKVAYSDTEAVWVEYSPDDRGFKDVGKQILSRDFSYNDLLIGNYIPFNSLLFKRQALIASGGINEELNLYEDWDLLIRLGKDFPFYHIKKSTARYNQWSNELQINRGGIEKTRHLHIAMIEKNRDKITSDVIFSAAYEDKERIRNELIHLQNKCTEIEEVNKVRDSYVEHLKEVIKTREELISQLEKRISLLQGSLNEIIKTLGWRILEQVRRIRERLFPHGSTRRRLLDMLIKPIKEMSNIGIHGFV